MKRIHRLAGGAAAAALGWGCALRLLEARAGLADDGAAAAPATWLRPAVLWVRMWGVEGLQPCFIVGRFSSLLSSSTAKIDLQ
jgi:hypothetical protein